MKTVDIVIPTLGHIKKTAHPYNCFERLHHIPWPYKLHVVTRGTTWGKAINIGLAQTRNDVILMDDDVFINESTFDLVDSFYDEADVFGFRLLFPDGRIQHAGGVYHNGMIGHIGFGIQDEGQFNDIYYTCHLTTSLIYIKRKVLDKLGGIHEMPGMQMDDVDFSFRALKAGFKLMYLPKNATHIESATKRSTPDFQAKINEAFEFIRQRHLSNPDFVKELERYPKRRELQLPTV